MTYDLHPTFRPSQVTVEDAPFLLVRQGWGYLMLVLRLNLRKRQIEKI